MLVSHKSKQQYQWISFQKDIENLPTIDGDWFSRLRPYCDCDCNHCWCNLIWSAALYLGGFTMCFLVLSCLVCRSKKWSGAKDNIEEFLLWNSIKIRKMSDSDRVWQSWTSGVWRVWQDFFILMSLDRPFWQSMSLIFQKGNLSAFQYTWVFLSYFHFGSPPVDDRQ